MATARTLNAAAPSAGVRSKVIHYNTNTQQSCALEPLRQMSVVKVWMN